MSVFFWTTLAFIAGSMLYAILTRGKAKKEERKIVEKEVARLLEDERFAEIVKKNDAEFKAKVKKYRPILIFTLCIGMIGLFAAPIFSLTIPGINLAFIATGLILSTVLMAFSVAFLGLGESFKYGIYLLSASIIISFAYAAGLMFVYFIQYKDMPLAVGGEFYPMMLMAIPVGILFLAFFIIWVTHAAGMRSLYVIFLPLILVVAVSLGTIFPKYQYSPQRIVLRLTGRGGRRVAYSWNNKKCNVSDIAGILNDSWKPKRSAYLIYTGNYFYYFYGREGLIIINKECVNINQA